MGVSGYLEIYTTAFGWQVYGLIWGILAATGIIWLPFLSTLYENWATPYRSQDDKPAVTVSVRRMGIDVVFMTFVIAIAAVPAIPVEIKDLRYTKHCPHLDEEKSVSGGDTGTTYDDMPLTVHLNQKTKVPLFWYLILSTGSGLSLAVSNQVPCLNSLRDWDSMLRTASIPDLKLQHEYSRFYSECYVPAMSKFKNPRYRNYINEAWDNFTYFYPDTESEFYSELNYIAPKFFVETAGFYRFCHLPRRCGVGGRAEYQVPGWPFELPRDGDYSEIDRAQARAGEMAGKPYCDEWWLGSAEGESAQHQLGLEQKLVKAAEGTNGIKLHTMAQQVKQQFTESDEWDSNRQIVQALLRNGPPEWTGFSFGSDSTSEKVAAITAGTLSAPEILSQLAGFHMAMLVVREGAPMAQALILMALYMLLPIYLLLASYRLESLVLITTILIAIKCWPALWTIADFIDENLFRAMYPDPNVLGGPSAFGIKRITLNIMTTSLFVLLPLILTWMMAWAGMSGARLVGGGVDQLSGTSSAIGQQAGAGATRKGTALAKAAITKGKSDGKK